jgi:repressor LexA
MQTRTRRQREVLEFISRYIESHGFEPSYQLIARHLGITSKAGVSKHVKALESQGLLKTRNENGRFTLEVKEQNHKGKPEPEIDWLDLPQEEWPDGWERHPFSIPGFLLGSLEADRIAAMLIADDSMQSEGICEGDVVLLERKAFVRDGDIVAAALKGSPPVIRRFYRNGSKIELRASEQDKPISGPADKIKVMGVYRGLIRPIKK